MSRFVILLLSVLFIKSVYADDIATNYQTNTRKPRIIKKEFLCLFEEF